MTITAPSGRTYEWKKDSPPTEKDWAEIQKYDSLSNEVQAARDVMADPKSNPVEKVGAVAPYAYYKAKDMLISAGLRGAPAAVGQVVGRRLAGTPGAMAGGGIGGALGSVADQGRLMAGGQQDKFSYGQLTADTLQGANPSRGMLKNAGANMAAVNAETLIDEGKLAGVERTNMAGAGALVGAGASQKMTGKSLTAFDDVMQRRLAIAKELRKEGVVFNPAELKRGSPALQMVAGKADLSSDFSIRNQPVWQRFGREDLGLDPQKVSGFKMKEITKEGNVIPGEIDDAIAKGYEPYETIRKISDEAKKKGKEYFSGEGGHQGAIEMSTPEGRKLLLEAGADIDKLKMARAVQSSAYERMKANEPGAFDAYQAARKQVNELEDAIDLAGQSVGDPKLLERLRAGRKQIAVGYAYLNATDSYTGLVNPKLLAQQFDEDPTRLTGRARQIAQFEKSFGRNAIEGSQVPTTGGNAMSANFAALSAAQGNPAGVMMAGLPAARGPVRDFIAWDYSQKKYVKPEFQPNREKFLSAFTRTAASAASRRTTGSDDKPVSERVKLYLFGKD